MKHLSYFLALVVIGTIVALIVFEPVAAMLGVLLTGLFRVSSTSPHVKAFEYGVIATLWTVVILVVWIRRGGLSPRAVRPGGNRRLALGHGLLLLGHVLLCAMFMPSLSYLMLLPIVGGLLAYAIGILLIETARARAPATLRR